ncbi:MAG TPA: TonB-dependent receptor [Marivirga sp.]|nr:TonB-dependent receptor [Marivirga sp.]
MNLLKKTILFFILSIGFAWQSSAQSTTISGTVIDAETKIPLIGVNVVVKGKVLGTTTDFDGNFSFNVNLPTPLTLQFSMVGYKTQEYTINDGGNNPERQTGGSTGIKIAMEEEFLMGQEVVVSASRVEESILQSPVSIEKMDVLDIQQTPADNYYKSIGYLKGVDVTQSSINFQIVNARGFNSTGNTRFVQLTDGMDTQAPALNFPIGNLNGPSELDVESVEMIPGAASALYGPNAFNGILLVNSKSPFEYQGFSAFTKFGMNHFGADTEAGAPSSPQPMYEASVRYAKSLFNDRFAFKVNASFMQAEDWYATNYTTDREAGRQGNLSFNPGSDYPNTMGDEASVNAAFLGTAIQSAFAADGTERDNETFQRLRTLYSGIMFQGSAPKDNQNFTDYLAFAPNQVVSRTPYEEHQLIDYGANNYKLNASAHYRLTDNIEGIYQWNYGSGTSIYTGAQRYSLSNFSIQQHKLELKSTDWFVRAYGTFENSGDSYITEFLGNQVNSSFSPNNTWFATYTANYLKEISRNYTPQELAALRANDPMGFINLQESAFSAARNAADRSRYEPGSEAFNEAKERALSSGTVPDGPSFADMTQMYHAEAQYDLTSKIDFASIQVGGSFRLYNLNSNGTIFPDTVGNPISIAEYGAYVQASKKVMDDKLKLTGSARVDKNQNFDAVFSPRLSAVYEVAENNNIRASFQTGFRNPTTQGQHINLNIISSRLLGGLPQYAETYGIGTDPNIYTLESVNAMINNLYSTGSFDESFLDNENTLNYESVKPEQVQSIEVGYKSLINKKIMIDAVYYYNQYNNFITQQRVRKAQANPDGSPNLSSLLQGNADNTFQIYTNAQQQIVSQGAAIGVDYSIGSGYTVGSNYNWNVLNTKNAEGQSFVFGFNTPEHKFNVKFGNRKLTDKIGFNVAYRWQSEFYWESSFGDGIIPAFGTLDAQISYKMPYKTLLKIGGSNLTNDYYIQSFGAPNIGAIYYVSLTFDQLTNR